MADKFNDNDWPEYEAVREFFAGMTDREKVIVSLVESFSAADNYGSQGGRYLTDLYQKIMKGCNDKMPELISQSESELCAFATLSEVLSGVTC